MEKSINFLNRDFEGIKSELINFSKQYYPEMSTNFNDGSVGSWIIDLVSAVGDELNYYIDRAAQETTLDSANSRSAIMNIAKMNGVKVPGPKPSICELQLSCVLPVGETIGNMSHPNWEYAPLIKRGSKFSGGGYTFEISENVDFAEQFNNDAYSNRTYIPSRNTNGFITGYTVTKSVMAYGGTSRIYKKILSSSDIEPFMEIVIPETDVMNVESIIFKEASTTNTEPELSEFYIDEEEYMIGAQAIKTYRYFEVESLSDQYRLGTETRFTNRSDGANIVANEYLPDDYVDYSDDMTNTVTRYYKAAWKPISQKFITEYTDNGYIKITFGSSNKLNPTLEEGYGKYISSKIVNNEMLGVLPKAGWTMYILYRKGGGVQSNLAQGSITTISNANVSLPHLENASDDERRNSVINSLSVTNTSPSLGGKDAPSNEELKNYIKYAVGAQKRCVTVKDYKAVLMAIPPKYGCPFRCNVMEDNNKINISVLGLNNDGTLNNYLPSTMVDNIKEYLSHYKTIGDYVDIRSGKIYHLGLEIDMYIDKNYTTSDVLSNVVSTTKEYFAVSNHDMGEDIFIGDLERELSSIDGVISLIDLRIYNIYGGKYSKYVCPLPERTYRSENCDMISTEFARSVGNGKSFQIDLEQTDNVLNGDFNAMYEIIDDNDICCRYKLR